MSYDTRRRVVVVSRLSDVRPQFCSERSNSLPALSVLVTMPWRMQLDQVVAHCQPIASPGQARDALSSGIIGGRGRSDVEKDVHGGDCAS